MPASVPVPAIVQHVQSVSSKLTEQTQCDWPAVLPFAFIDRKQFADYRRRLWSRDPHCVYCRERISTGKETLDHVRPKCDGGIDTPSNLVLSCETCNKAKGGRSAVEWRDNLIAACEMIGGDA